MTSEHPIRIQRYPQTQQWSDYPLGTKAHAFNGGHWVRVALGWKWFTGSTFPTPGGDALGNCIELPLLDYGADLTGHHVEYWGGEWIVEEMTYLGSWSVVQHYQRDGEPWTRRSSIGAELLPETHPHFARLISTRLTLPTC
jgi:hypothetical protein